MDRLATGIAIAATALILGAGLGPDATAAEPGTGASETGATRSHLPPANGPSGERVLGLVLTLEALRAAPALLDPRKV